MKLNTCIVCMLYFDSCLCVGVCLCSSVEAFGWSAERPRLHKSDAIVSTGAEGAAGWATKESIHLRCLLWRLHQTNINFCWYQFPQTTQVWCCAHTQTIQTPVLACILNPNRTVLLTSLFTAFGLMWEQTNLNSGETCRTVFIFWYIIKMYLLLICWINSANGLHVYILCNMSCMLYQLCMQNVTIVLRHAVFIPCLFTSLVFILLVVSFAFYQVITTDVNLPTMAISLLGIRLWLKLFMPLPSVACLNSRSRKVWRHYNSLMKNIKIKTKIEKYSIV